MTFTKLTLRMVVPEDKPFIQDVYFETQRWLIEALFGWRGDEIELAKFAESYDAGNTSIIVVDDDDVGWLTVQRGEHIELEAIYLKPSAQGRSIGTAVVQDLISEAQSAAKPLRLSTAKINPARQLYERLGFVDVGESEFKTFMEWRPACPQTTRKSTFAQRNTAE